MAATGTESGSKGSFKNLSGQETRNPVSARGLQPLQVPSPQHSGPIPYVQKAGKLMPPLHRASPASARTHARTHTCTHTLSMESCTD